MTTSVGKADDVSLEWGLIAPVLKKYESTSFNFDLVTNELKSSGVTKHLTQNEIVCFLAFEHHHSVHSTALENEQRLVETFFRTCDYFGKEGMTTKFLFQMVDKYESQRKGVSDYQSLRSLELNCEKTFAKRTGKSVGEQKMVQHESDRIRDVCRKHLQDEIARHKLALSTDDLSSKVFETEPTKIAPSLKLLNASTNAALTRELDSLWNFLSSMTQHPFTWSTVAQRKQFLEGKRTSSISQDMESRSNRSLYLFYLLSKLYLYPSVEVQAVQARRKMMDRRPVILLI
jgi:hypothetical protein